MSDSNQYSGAHLLLAFLAGAAGGAVAAALTSPASGREAREKMREWPKDLPEKAGVFTRAARAAYDRAADAAKEANSDTMTESATKPEPQTETAGKSA